MWGAMLIVLSLSGATQAAPHPATRAPYQPPSIMPYQPPSTFLLEILAEGDRVDGRAAARGAAGFDTSERDYDAAVAMRERQADAQGGDLDGVWIATDEQARTLFTVMLATRDGRTEGGWRRRSGAGAADLADGALVLHGLGALVLDGGDGGVRHGRLDRRPVTLTRTP